MAWSPPARQRRSWPVTATRRLRHQTIPPYPLCQILERPGIPRVLAHLRIGRGVDPYVGLPEATTSQLRFAWFAPPHLRSPSLCSSPPAVSPKLRQSMPRPRRCSPCSQGSHEALILVLLGRAALTRSVLEHWPLVNKRQRRCPPKLRPFIKPLLLLEPRARLRAIAPTL